MALHYRRRFEAMAEELHRHPAVEVRQVEFADPAPAAVLAQVAEMHGGVVPGCLLDLYSQMNGFSVRWVHTLTSPQGPRGDADTGTINIRPVSEVFGPGPARRFLDEDDRFRPVRPFDVFTPEACVAFLQSPDGAIRDEANLHVFGEGTLSTGHTAEAYLDRLLVSRGMWSWTGTLCADLQDLPEVADFRRTAPLLFTDYDDTFFRPGP